MKTNIYYFTGTGNSLKVAKDLAQSLGDTELISIVSSMRKDQIQDNSDTIGIVFPVYIWGLPLIVKKFAERLRTKENAYIFALTTYGGMPAGTLPQLNKILKNKGQKLSAGFGIRMPGNYTPMYGALPKEKQIKMFDIEKEKIKKFTEIVKNRQPYKIQKNSFLVNLLFSSIIYKGGSSQMPGMDKSFWADANCDGCGICVKVCPKNNVQLKSTGRPKWLHNCEQCLACMQWCPKKSIQFGKKTSGRERYQHPDIKAEDIITQKAL